MGLQISTPDGQEWRSAMIDPQSFRCRRRKPFTGCCDSRRDRAPNDGPVLVDAVVNRTELAMPSVVTLEMAKGFTLYIVKAVISGRGGELIDLARTNL
jgi:hypothetical protein